MHNRINIKSKSGSTLIWVLIMMLVLGILIAGGLMIAQSFTTRTLNQHVEQQSYYTALSTTKSIAEWMNGTSEDQASSYPKQLSYIENLKKQPNKSYKFNSTIDTELGTSETTISLESDDSIKISTTAKYIDEESTVYAILKKSTTTIGGDGDGTGIDRPLIISTPNDTPIDGLENNYKGESSVAKIHTVFNKGDSFVIANRFASDANPTWQAQYYELHSNGGNSSEDSFIKLINGNRNDGGFPVTKNNTIFDRHMTIFSKKNIMQGNYANLVMYTQELKEGTQVSDKNPEPPRKDITILPNVDVKNNNGDASFGNIHNSDYRNLRIQINDTGNAVDNYKAKLVLPRGLTLSGNSSIYTRRDTIIGQNYDGSNGTYPKENTNKSNFNHTDNTGTPKFTLEGDLYVADNETTLYHGNNSNVNVYNQFKGDIIIKKTTTDEARLNVGQYINISNGTIYVGDGGYLQLNWWNTLINNDIYVYPGGTVDIQTSPVFNCNIYVYSGHNSDGVPAKIKLSGNNRFSGKMMNLEGNEVLGGIFLEGSENGQGPVVEMNASSGYFGDGCIHAMPGAIIPSEVHSNNFCDQKVRNEVGDKICDCHIKIPDAGSSSGSGSGGGGGQEVASWQIYKYGQ